LDITAKSMHNKLFCADKALNKSQENTMPSSPEEKEFTSYVVDLMQSIGPVNAKAMFGGYGIFLEGLMFRLVADSVLYLKIDKETENEFKAKGLEQFTYNKKGKEFKMSYYQAPEEALENGEEMSFWAAKAYSTALRAASNKRKK
jgi:DNA transformation protein